jgi:hypothetical protein
MECDDEKELYDTANKILGRIALAALTMLLAPVLFFAAYKVYAFEAEKPAEKWGVIGCCSWHSDHGGTSPPRQINPGFGFEYGRKDLRFVGGGFINSRSKDSGFLGWRQNLYRWDERWASGYTAAWVSGYGDDMLPVVVPTLALEGKEYGLNIMGAYWKKKVVIGLSFKKKF